ncbi:histone deacetylase [Pseudodesulfovibrio sp. JC047]|uniref:histone deacetylase family protein n=1 Tax=Pseudodesulfovibrio sp. JC047 TaxID=2683199 RepID=UPI0013D43187|nr:histone deacetylase [Pseudodesulfovibrio sp. JC047]NDV20135.1 histone deacetylase [Pseudodesulfovibrio sp. JC047]
MLKSTNRLGIIFFPAFDWAISPTHPERQERLLYTQDQLREEGIFDIEGVREYKPDVASIEDVERVHFCFPEVPSVATRSHLISAGGAIKAADLVMEGERDCAFAMVRPPGHHAMKVVHGSRGFCTINIEAVMIEHIREKYGRKKVAIVDTDCHHGDGSQDVYWNDPDTLFISIHQDGRTLYPGSGFPHELGGPNARGKTLNIPLPPNTSDEGFLMAMERVVMPILDDFKPDLIINSAGQDNHFSDPITNMNFSAKGYAALNDMLKPDIAVLEGGYSIQGALPYINLGICLAMAGVDYSHVKEPNYNPDMIAQDAKTTAYIEKLCDHLPRLYFDPPSYEATGDRESGVFSGDTLVRHRQIYYDTDGINEVQQESVTVCDSCRGLYKVETRADSGPLCLGVEIPIDACPACRRNGYKLIEDAQLKGNYRYIQLINRLDKEYQRYGF